MTATSPPEVSVIMPTHNRREMLPQTLGAALGQESVDHEVIVVDDGSTDGTAEYLATIRDPRLRVLSTGGRGTAVARNSGLAVARGEWVALHDDDDLWAPRKLCEQLAAATRAGADVVFSSVIVVDPELTPIDLMIAVPVESWEHALARFCAVPAGPSNLVTKTHLLRRIGGFDEQIEVMADWDAFIRLAQVTGRVVALPEVHVAYREHPGGITVTALKSIRADLARSQRNHGAWGRAQGMRRLGDRRFWQWYEQSARRAGDRREATRVLAYRALRFRSPVDGLRAIVMLVAGERGMRKLSRLTPESPTEPPEAPPWLVEPVRAAKRERRPS